MASKIKRLALLGSTGSIGQQTLQVVRALPDHFHIVGLAAGMNTALFQKQIDEFKPRFVCCQDKKLESSLVKTQTELLSLEEIATQPQMRRINFAEAVYRGKELRAFPA